MTTRGDTGYSGAMPPGKTLASRIGSTVSMPTPQICAATKHRFHRLHRKKGGLYCRRCGTTRTIPSYTWTMMGTPNVTMGTDTLAAGGHA